LARRKILLVDDDPSVRRLLAGYFSENGFLVEEAASFAAALTSFQSVRPDVAVVDFQLPDGTALQLLPKLKELEPLVPIIVLTGFGSMELGVALIKNGAEQCLAKPIEPPALALIVQKVLANRRNEHSQIAARSNRKRLAVDPFVGESDAIRRLADTAVRVSSTNTPVLIQGETGVGKGVLANWLHENSDRFEEAFVDLNCAGLSKEFLETELFGYEKGAYTGAVNPKSGLLEIAHRGTVFLDEIGDVDQNVQPKLLKVVEEKRFRRMGDVRDRFVDVRLVAATHQDLSRLIMEKKFRSDLYFRISTVPILIPPLRERSADIAVLANQLLHRITGDLGRQPTGLSAAALSKLQAYHWPGNIRELRNVLERALLLTEKKNLEPEDFQFEDRSASSSPSAYASTFTLAEVERLHIETVLREEGFNVPEAAKRLAIPKSSLYQKIKVMKIERNGSSS
jgi:DNA-binding NtrC family response regulator